MEGGEAVQDDESPRLAANQSSPATELRMVQLGDGTPDDAFGNICCHGWLSRSRD